MACKYTRFCPIDLPASFERGCAKWKVLQEKFLLSDASATQPTVCPAAVGWHVPSSVPEPSTMDLLGLSLLGLGFARRAQKKV